MRAIVVTEQGGPERLQLAERDRPTAGAGQLVVETHAAGVNFYDTYVRSGVYSARLPFTPGREASGTVVEVGPDVEGFAVGDRVATVEGKGTYAEFFAVSADDAMIVPADVHLDVAAAVALQGLTAHYLATSVAEPQQGDSAIVHAGAGGVGLLLTQILAARGVRVFTTVSTPEKAELSRAAGASEVFSYDDFRERSRAATDGDGVAVVYDGVGATTFDDSLASLRIRGTLALFGGSSGQVPPFDLQRLNSSGSISVVRPTLGHYMLTPEEKSWRWGELFDALAGGTLDVRIGARFPLADAARAHEALEGRQTTGKVILRP